MKYIILILLVGLSYYFFIRTHSNMIKTTVINPSDAQAEMIQKLLLYDINEENAEDMAKTLGYVCSHNVMESDLSLMGKLIQIFKYDSNGKIIRQEVVNLLPSGKTAPISFYSTSNCVFAPYKR